MPTQQRLPLRWPQEVERELMRQAFDRLPAKAQGRGFEAAMQNGAMVIGLRRMAERQKIQYPHRHS